MPTDMGLIAKFNAHLTKEDEVRKTCPTDAGKAWLTIAKSYHASATSTEMDSASIAAAAELPTLTALRPLVFHDAVEQSGGTAITRSNVFYSFGFPGAATLSAGLLVSFRLDNPVSGNTMLTGFVRCAVAPKRFQNIAKIVAAKGSNPAPQDRVACSYITS